MKIKNMLYAAMFAAIVAVLGLMPPIPLPFIPVPITLQTMGVMLAGSFLGKRLGFLSMLLVVVIVLLGVPILSGGRGGLAVLTGPTGGFFIVWPFAAFLFALTVTLKPFRNKKINIWANILAIPAMIFAVCSEQIAVLGLIIFAGIVIKNIIENKKVSKLALFFMIISAIGIMNVLIAPGNAVRTAKEIKNWWPEFKSIGLKQKVLNGTIVTFSRLFLSPEIPAVILVISLVFLAFKKINSKALVSILPSAGILGLFFAPISTLSSYTSLTTYFVEIRNIAHGMDSRNMGDIRFRFFILILAAIFTLSISLTIYFIYGKTNKTLYIVYVLTAGVVTAMMISFSPTLFGSSTRTLYFLVVILCAVDFVIIQDLIKDRFKLKIRK